MVSLYSKQPNAIKFVPVRDLANPATPKVFGETSKALQAKDASFRPLIKQFSVLIRSRLELPSSFAIIVRVIPHMRFMEDMVAILVRQPIKADTSICHCLVGEVSITGFLVLFA